MVIKLESDFRKTRSRFYLDTDPDLKEGMAFMIRGKQYARKEMWALAAVHMRRALALMPFEADGYLATAVACSNLKDYDLAYAILEDAQRKDPNNTRIKQALAVFASEAAQSIADDQAGMDQKELIVDTEGDEVDEQTLPEVQITQDNGNVEMQEQYPEIVLDSEAVNLNEEVNDNYIDNSSQSTSIDLTPDQTLDNAD
jgi:tetratricopeptide (TPR) repeat protein